MRRLFKSKTQKKLQAMSDEARIIYLLRKARRRQYAKGVRRAARREARQREALATPAGRGALQMRCEVCQTTYSHDSRLTPRRHRCEPHQVA